jgi:threonine dehydratase
MTVDLASIHAARDRLASHIYRSPAPWSMSLSRLTGSTVHCKLEHLQMTGAFKERGARNKLLLLEPEARQRGVVAASAGNHALGLAWHGRQLGIPVCVVMPRFAPLMKIANCRSFGAEVVLHGDDFSSAREEAQRMAASDGRTFVPAFEDADVIAGQGTIGLELVEDVPNLDAVIVPVGGGGLLAGVGTAIKALRPSVQVIGVEPDHAACLTAALAAGRPVDVPVTSTLADGLAVARMGDLTFQLCRQVVDRVVTVSEESIARAILRLLEMEKAVVEGAGATALAALMTGRLGLENRTVAMVLSGGNIDLTTVGRIIERGLAADGRLARLTVHLDDRPGRLARLLHVVAETGASIRDIDHDRSFAGSDPVSVGVSLVVETRDADHIHVLYATVTAAGFVADPPTGTPLPQRS